MLKGVGSFFLLMAISGTGAFGCDSPPPDSRAAGAGGVTGVGGASTLGGTSTSRGMANTGGAPVSGTSTDQRAHQATDAGANSPCVGQGTLGDDLTPLHGTIRGPSVDGVLCNNGVGTFFLGPSAGLSSYQQALQTTMDLVDPRTDDFLFSEPTNVFSAVLDGYAGASGAAVGMYSSADNCGWLTLKLIFPIPNVACTTEFSPCDPGCEPTNGEMLLCAPAHPTRLYEALPSAQCTPGEAALGEWGLTLTSVSPNPSPSGLDNNLTHGRLTATLISETDPSDSVQLDLEF